MDKIKAREKIEGLMNEHKGYFDALKFALDVVDELIAISDAEKETLRTEKNTVTETLNTKKGKLREVEEMLLVHEPDYVPEEFVKVVDEPVEEIIAPE